MVQNSQLSEVRAGAARTRAGMERVPREPDRRWVARAGVVLEHSGEFLAPDAKQLNGQALSRLLNVCDGRGGRRRARSCW